MRSTVPPTSVTLPEGQQPSDGRACRPGSIVIRPRSSLVVQFPGCLPPRCYRTHSTAFGCRRAAQADVRNSTLLV
jgi:hypothetical protein